MDTDTRKALREVAAGKVEQFSITELEGLGLMDLESLAGRLDDDAIMQQAEQLLEAHTEVEVDSRMRSRLDEIHNLSRLANPGVDLDEWSNDELLSLDIGYGVEGPLSREYVQEAAEERLNEYPLAVKTTTVFEVVIGTGGPGDRLIFECGSVECRCAGDHCGGHEHYGSPDTGYEINRVLYRYSWTGSAERVLDGEDRETAEELARRVVPELVE